MAQQEANCSVGNCEIYPAGFVQRREWMLYKIKHNHHPANPGLSFELDGFDDSLFQRVIDLMVERHEILRTTLKVIGGELKQVVHNAANFPVGFTFYDITKKTEEQRQGFIDHIKVFQYSMPFNFEFGPLFRILVIRKDDRQVEAFIFFSHVIFDLHSTDIFRNDAAKIWGALVRGSAPVFSGEQAQYKTYSDFENRLLNTALGEPYREYWKEQLAQEYQRLLIIDEARWNAYFDYHRGKIETVKKKIMSLPFYDLQFIAPVVLMYKEERGGSLRYVYNNETFKNIQEFKKNCNSSLTSLLIASLILAFNRLSGQELFVFSTFVPRKNNGAHKNIIGWLTTNCTGIFDIRQNTNAGAFLAYIDEQLFQLSRHSIYPAETLDHGSDVPMSSLVPVYLIAQEVEHIPDVDVQNSGIISHEYENSNCYQYLAVHLSMSSNACSVNIIYNNFLFPPKLIEQIVGEQESCINSVARNMLWSEITI